MNYRLWGTLLVSVLVHGALLRGVAAPDTDPPEVAVDAGKTSVAIQVQKPEKKTKEKTEEKPEPKEPEPEKSEPEKPDPRKKPDREEPEEQPEPQKQEEAKETEKEQEEQPEEKQETTPSQKQTGARMVEPAEYRRNPSPEYPTVSRRRGEEGTVMLRVRVGKDGNPVNVISVEQESSRLAREALDRMQTFVDNRTSATERTTGDSVAS